MNSVIFRRGVKILLALTSVIVAAAVLSGCGTLLKNGFDEDEYIEKRMQAVIEAADKDDADKLMELFCENVRSGNAELKEEAEIFIKAVDGAYVSGERNGYTESDESDRDSYYKKKVSGGYTVETTSGKYVLTFDDVAQTYSGKEQYQGLLSLGVQDYDDYMTESCLANGFLGIYVVTPDNHALVALMRTAYTPELLEEQVAEAIARFNLTEKEYEDLTAEQKDNLLRIEQIFSEMEYKYDKTFCSPQEFSLNMLDEKTDQLMLYPEDGDPKNDCFTAYWNEENGRFFDNYQDIIIQNLMGNMIARQLASGGIDARVKVIAEIQDTNFAFSKTDITEYDIDGNVTADCTVFIEETGSEGESEERNQICRIVRDWFAGQHISGDHHLLILQKDEFDTVTIENYTDLPADSILYQEYFDE